MTSHKIQRRRLTPGFLLWGVVIAVLLIVGGISFYTVFSDGLIVTNLTNSIPWGLWITIDLSAIALGVLEHSPSRQSCISSSSSSTDPS